MAKEEEMKLGDPATIATVLKGTVFSNQESCPSWKFPVQWLWPACDPLSNIFSFEYEIEIEQILGFQG